MAFWPNNNLPQLRPAFRGSLQYVRTISLYVATDHFANN